MSVYYKENPVFLKKSIDSIINQTIQTNDFVIVEDGLLTEELDAVLEEYAKKYEFIKLIKLPENHGLGYALNIGLKECKNELVGRMDSDDLSLPNRFEEELKLFEDNGSLCICGSSIIEFDSDDEKTNFVKTMPISFKEIKKYARRRNPFNHPTVLFKKNAVLKFGGYPETRRGEDLELFTKMVFEDCYSLNIETPLLKYRSSFEQLKRRKTKQETKCIIDIAKKNYKSKYISFFDYFSVVIIQISFRILPTWLIKTIYKRRYKGN